MRRACQSDLCFVDNQVNGRIGVADLVVVTVLVDQPCIHPTNQPIKGQNKRIMTEPTDDVFDPFALYSPTKESPERPPPSNAGSVFDPFGLGYDAFHVQQSPPQQQKQQQQRQQLSQQQRQLPQHDEVRQEEENEGEEVDLDGSSTASPQPPPELNRLTRSQEANETLDDIASAGPTGQPYRAGTPQQQGPSSMNQKRSVSINEAPSPVDFASEAGSVSSRRSTVLPPKLLVRFHVHEEVSSVAISGAENEGSSDITADGTVTVRGCVLQSKTCQ